MSKNKLDIVASINSIFPRGVEFHTLDQGDDGIIRKSSFTGPNTDLKTRLENYDNTTGSYTSVNTPPINDLDRGAMLHDIAYHNKDLNARHKADGELIKVADLVLNDINATPVQKFNAGLVKSIMAGKVFLGVGIEKNKRGLKNREKR